MQNYQQYLSRYIASCKENLCFLLLINFFLGACLGFMGAGWQVAIEPAQVFLGLVSYPAGLLPYLYNTSSFALINNITTLLLALSKSEMVTSLLISAFLGILVQQTLAMAVFLVFRNSYYATLAALAIVIFHLMGDGISYPIFVGASEHSYARMGLTAIIYTALFLAFGYYRIGLFFCGLCLWVHAVWGIWLGACLACVFLLRFRECRALVTASNIASLLLGVAVSAAAFLWQKTHYPNLLPPISPENATIIRDIFLNYIRYWDHHRQKFDNPHVLFIGLSLACLSLFISSVLLSRYSHKRPFCERMFFLFVIISALLSSIFVFVPSWFDPAYFPATFIILMPGKYINVAIFLASPMLFGSAGLWLSKQAGRLPAPMHAFINPFYITCFMAVACAALVIILPVQTLHRHKVIKEHFIINTLPPNVHGAVLTTMEYYLLQAENRIPVLNPHIDGYVYQGDAVMIPFDTMIKDLFGISLRTAPLRNYDLHQGYFDTADFKDVWENRSCNDWAILAQRYHFDFIMVPEWVHLKLPQVSTNPNGYYPRCAVMPSSVPNPGAGAQPPE